MNTSILFLTNMTSKAGAVDVGEPPLLVHGSGPQKGGFITSLGAKAHYVLARLLCIEYKMM